MLKRSEMFTFRNQFHLRMYQRLEFTQEVSIQHPIAAYKLHTVYFATDLIGCPKAGKGLMLDANNGIMTKS